jgi:carbon storage regulator CsrA
MNREIGFYHGGSNMLILSRKSSESVVVGDPADGREQVLVVTVLEINGCRVRLGFEVSDDVPVNRLEVVQLNRSGSRTPGDPSGSSPPLMQ